MKSIFFSGYHWNAAEAVAEFLLAGKDSASSGGIPDLSGNLVVLPGRNAIRRVSAALALAAGKRGLFPPDFLTPGAFLRYGRNGKTLPMAQEEIVLWEKILRRSTPEEISALAPPGFAGNTADRMMLRRLAEMLHSFRSELLLAPCSIAECSSLPAFRGSGRWFCLTMLEQRFTEELKHLGRIDPLEEYRSAIASTAPFKSVRKLIFACVPDLVPCAGKRLNAIDKAGICPIEIFVHAPGRLKNFFDEYGILKPEAWAGHKLDFGAAPGRIHAAETPGDLARLARMLAPGPDGIFDPAKTTPAIADTSLFPFLEHEFSSFQLHDGSPLEVYDPAGVSPASLRITPLLKLLELLCESPSAETVKSLLRHPDLLRALAEKAGCLPDELLTKSDVYFAEHLPDLLQDHSPAAEEELQSAFNTILRIRNELLADKPHNEILRNILASIFTDPAAPPVHGVSLESEAALTASLLEEFAKSPLLAHLEMREFLASFAAALRSERLYGEHAPGALGIPGFLDLLFSAGKRIILCGMSEGILPETCPSNPFLSDSKRRILGLPDNASRLARDSFYLESLIEPRKNTPDALHFLASKFSANGNSQRFSTLFFKAPDPVMLERAGVLSAPAPLPDPHRGKQAGDPGAFQLKPDVSRAFLKDGVTTLSVTAFKPLLASPLRAFLALELGMGELDYNSPEMNPLQIGNACHGALQTLTEHELRSPETTRAALEKRLMNFLTRQFGTPLPLFVDTQRELLIQRLAAASAPLAESAREFRVLCTEWSLNQGKGILWENSCIRGRIDRIEIAPEKNLIRLIDFKTSDRGETPEETHLTGRKSGKISFTDLQLPLYRILLPLDGSFRTLLAGKFPAFRFDEKATVLCGYFNLPKNVSDTGYRMWETLDPLLENAKDTVRSVLKAVEDLRNGILTENPEKKVKYDDFAALLKPDPAAALTGVRWKDPATSKAASPEGKERNP